MEDYSQILINLKQALDLSPDNLPLHLSYAKTLFVAGKIDEALIAYQAILQKDTQNYEALSGLGKCFFEKAEYGQAAAVFTTLSAGNPRDPEVLMWLAKAQRETGDIPSALKAFEQANDLKASDHSLVHDSQNSQAEKEEPFLLTNVQNETEDDSNDWPDLIDKNRITFNDVGGLEHVKEQIRIAIIYPQLHPEIYQAYGKKVGGGMLFYGPPGCGKTHLARATAGECGRYFISISIHEVVNMYIGQTEKNIHAIFETARKYAPSVLFIDEIEALAPNRQDLGGHLHHYRMITNQFLEELDGASQNNENILFIGATNTPWAVDFALRRPGRFDRSIFIAPPDTEARISIFQLYTKGRPVDVLDYKKLAEMSKWFSGADIFATAQVAADAAMSDAMKTGKMRNITMNDFTQAIKQIRSSTYEWLATAKNYAKYSNESGMYNDVLEWMQINKF